MSLRTWLLTIARVLSFLGRREVLDFLSTGYLPELIELLENIREFGMMRIWHI